MGLTDIIDITEYTPKWLKYLVFIIIIGVVASVFNSAILAGKGSLVCDSNRDAYILDERPSYLSPFNFLLDEPERTRIKENDDIIRRIERKREIEQGELNALLITNIPYRYKDPEKAGAYDCVKCSIGNDSDCRTQSGNLVKYEQMEDIVVIDSFWEGLGNIFNFQDRLNCGKAPLESSSERINITINLENRSFISSTTDDVKWMGLIYQLDTDLELDNLIHANGDLYANRYARAEGGKLTSKAFPVRCTSDYDPEVTLLGVPLFNASFWIMGTLLFLMFKMYLDLRKISTRKR